jgi:hypothetical protein
MIFVAQFSRPERLRDAFSGSNGCDGEFGTNSEVLPRLSYRSTSKSFWRDQNFCCEISICSSGLPRLDFVEEATFFFILDVINHSYTLSPDIGSYIHAYHTIQWLEQKARPPRTARSRNASETTTMIRVRNELAQPRRTSKSMATPNLPLSCSPMLRQ